MDVNAIASAMMASSNGTDFLLQMAFVGQAKSISRSLDRLGYVTPTRRIKARAKGYSGPLTRREVSKLAE